MPFVEDLTPFLQESEFSTKALILDTGAEVPVIFDNGYEGGLGGLAEASGPSVLGTTAQLQSLVHGSGLLLPKAVGSTELEHWAVTGNQPDGTGMTLLTLRKA